MDTPLALVRMPIAPLHAEPRVSSPQVSQALFGHVLWLHEPRGDWHRARGTDDYEGWVHEGYLTLLDAEDAAARRDGGLPAADAMPRVSLGCTVQAGARRLALPLGAWVLGGQEVLDGETVPYDALPARFPHDGAALAASAPLFAGASYQWGGRTPWGADCSGFVQAVAALHGIDLPRDAWQQALVGADAGTDVAALRPGDLLFFSDREDRRVTHVGLALGASRMAHVALGRGGWAEEDLSDTADPYVARLRGQLTGTRRIV